MTGDTLEVAISRLKQAMAQHGIRSLTVAIDAPSESASPPRPSYYRADPALMTDVVAAVLVDGNPRTIAHIVEAVGVLVDGRSYAAATIRHAVWVLMRAGSVVRHDEKLPNPSGRKCTAYRAVE